MFILTYDHYAVVRKCKFYRLYLYTIQISQQKNGACFDSSQLIVFRPSSICTCGSKAKCKPAFDWNVTVSFQLFLTQENDFDIDSDFEDFDSDEESDSELVW